MKSADLATVRDTLWKAADELRANSTLAPNEYRGPVLGLIFLAYAEHRFEQVTPELEAKATARRPVTPDDYKAKSVLYIPDDARLSHLVELPEGQDLGKAVDAAMTAVETQQPRAQGRPPQGIPAPREVDARRAAPPLRTAPEHPLRRRVRPHLRRLPLELRDGRRPTRRRVLHAALDRAPHRRDHRAVPRPRLRPGLRLGRHVRAVRQVRRGAPRLGQP